MGGSFALDVDLVTTPQTFHRTGWKILISGMDTSCGNSIANNTCLLRLVGFLLPTDGKNDYAAYNENSPAYRDENIDGL